MKMPDDLQKWANEAAEEIRSCHACNTGDCDHELQTDCHVTLFKDGIQAMWEKLSSTYKETNEPEKSTHMLTEPNKRVGFFDDQEG